MNAPALPSLSCLKAFESAARHRSYTAAGAEVNVSHAAVLQQVRRLEAFLGTPLMQRDGAGLSITPEGAALATRLTEGFGIINDAVTDLIVHEADRPLHVSMTPSFAVRWLMPRIATFRAWNPDIELMLNPSVDLVDIKGGTFDLGIRFGTGGWPGLEGELLVPSNFVVVAARDLVERERIKTLDDLMRVPWLQELGTDEFVRWLAVRGVRAENKHDITHLPGHMLLEALRDGQGIGSVARVFVEDEVRAGRLVILFEEDPDVPTGYHLVYRSGVMRPALKTFVAWLRRAALDDGAERY